MRILGSDVSTTTIGLCVIEVTDNNLPVLIYHDYYKPDKSSDILNMLVKARSHILEIAKRFNIDEFVIEDFIRFMKGSSSSATIIPLSILNVNLRLVMMDFGAKVTALNVLKIRHALKFDKKLPSKEDMPNIVSRHLGLEEFPWRYKINRKTKQSEKIVENLDIADSIACVLCYLKSNKQQSKKK